jgi:hypothetical protein
MAQRVKRATKGSIERFEGASSIEEYNALVEAESELVRLHRAPSKPAWVTSFLTFIAYRRKTLWQT